MKIKKILGISKNKKYLIFVLFLMILIYQILVSPYFLNILIPKFLENLKELEIQFKIQKSSILTGFEIDNISIYDKISKEPILILKKFKINYFLPGFFLGHIGIKELSLEEPKIFLIKNNNRWNFESLIPTSTKEEKEEQEETSVLEIIKTYLALKLYFYFNIKNLELTYKTEKTIESRKITLEHFELKNLSFYAGFITKTFNEIPLNTKLLYLLDDFVIQLNPQKNFYILYKKSEDVSGNPIAFVKIYKTSEKDLIFSSQILLNTNDMNFKKNNQNLFLKTEFFWDVEYTPDKKEFLIKQISLKNQENYLLNLKGKLQKLEDDWYLELEQQKDNIVFSLYDYGKIISLISDQSINFDGNLIFNEFFLKGKLTNLETRIQLNSNFFYFNRHHINNLNLSLHSFLNLKNILSFLYDQNKIEERETLAFGIIKNLELQDLSLSYNQSGLKLTGEISSKISLNLNFSNFNIGMFLDPYWNGNLNGFANLTSNLDLSELNLYLNASLHNSRFSVENYFSSPFNLFLEANGNIFLQDSTNLRIQVHSLSAKKITDNSSIIEISGNTDLFFGRNFSKYNIFLNNLSINYFNLFEHLPMNLKDTIYPYQNILKKGIQIAGNASLEFGNKNFYQTNINLLLPSLHPEPISLNLALQQNQTFIDIQKLIFQGWYNSLLVILKGKLEKKADWIPDLKLFFQYQNPNYIEIYSNLFLKGKILLELSLQNKTAKGNLLMDKLSFKYILTCDKQNLNLCQYFEVFNTNLNLPFFYEINKKTLVSFQENEFYFKPKINFSIGAILSNYSLDNQYFSNGFYFFGSKNKNALEGSIEFNNNIIWIPYFELFSFINEQKNGEIVLKNFYLNLSDLNPKNLHFNGKIFIINYDLNSLFPKAESIYKGNISSYIFFNGKDFTDLVRNLDLNISIYQISKDFAGFLVRIIAPTIISATVNNTLSIKNIELELKNGLVYTNIRVKSPGFFSLSKLIKPENEEIKQERIPLAEFLKRSEEELHSTKEIK